MLVSPITRTCLTGDPVRYNAVVVTLSGCQIKLTKIRQQRVNSREGFSMIQQVFMQTTQHTSFSLVDFTGAHLSAVISLNIAQLATIRTTWQPEWQFHYCNYAQRRRLASKRWIGSRSCLQRNCVTVVARQRRQTTRHALVGSSPSTTQTDNQVRHSLNIHTLNFVYLPS